MGKFILFDLLHNSKIIKQILEISKEYLIIINYNNCWIIILIKL